MDSDKWWSGEDKLWIVTNGGVASFIADSDKWWCGEAKLRIVTNGGVARLLKVNAFSLELTF